MTIDRTTDAKEIIFLVKGPYFGLCNDYDRTVAKWVSENCQNYDGTAEKILRQVMKLCPRDKQISPTISAILQLIIKEPRRFTEDKFVYKTVFGLRRRFPEVWKTFLKNAEKVNRHSDWLRLAADLGYNGPRDYWDMEHYQYVMKMLEQTADQRD